MAEKQTQSYLQQIAEIRQQRAQQEYQARAQEILTEFQENTACRDQAARDGDAEMWHIYDRECERLEHEAAAYMPPQQPQVDPKMVEFMRRNQSFFDRFGQRAAYAADLADAYITRPRVRGERNPLRTGMGLQRGSAQYFAALKDLLEMHGKDYGVHFDRGEAIATPNEAAKLSGLSARDYNRARSALIAQGRLVEE